MKLLIGQAMSIHPVAEAAAMLALVLAMGAGVFWLMKRLRDVDVNDGPDASGMLTKFRDLHTRGGLSDDEYRTIKTKLAGQLQADMGVPAADLPAKEEGDPKAEE